MNLIPYFIEFNDKNEPNKTVWKYKSDFALLHLPECSFTQELAKPIIDVSHLDCDNLPIIGESVFLFGIASFDYEGVEEENEIAKFKAKKLNVSNGRVTKVSETICEYNAEVVKGMDGGPVFNVRGGNLVPIGIHIGGIDDNPAQNYLIPFCMKELKTYCKYYFRIIF